MVRFLWNGGGYYCVDRTFNTGSMYRSKTTESCHLPCLKPLDNDGKRSTLLEGCGGHSGHSGTISLNP